MKCWQLLSFAALVVGSPVPFSIEDYSQLLKRQDVSVSQQELTDFQFFSEHAAAAYCNFDTPAGQPVKCNGTCNDVKATVVNSFVGEKTEIGAYVAVDETRQEIVLSVRGSNTKQNFVTDGEFLFDDCDLTKDCKVHSGFSKAWNEIANGSTEAIKQAQAANPGFKIVATGHSLGAAVATLGAAILRQQGNSVDLFTYGSPRVGNSEFADFVTNQPGGSFRVTHVDDPVPRLPPLFIAYRHTSPEFWLSTGNATTEDYGVADIKVCVGNANTTCNASGSGFDRTAHGHYFRKMTDCAPSHFNFLKGILKRKNTIESDAINRLIQWSQKDREFAAELEKRENLP